MLSCPEATVASNEITSAYAAIFSIRFAPKKFRAVSTRPNPGVVKLYDWNWEVITRPEDNCPDGIPFQGPEALIKRR